MNINGVIDWLMTGDISIQYQVQRDLLDKKLLLTKTTSFKLLIVMT
jgi:hypothetical protein